ncbi:DUF4232 domain-containing protein [Streptomyces sp. HU2014]|uniref:DUF4232 domain-containing protein n=1 Tax=Streptomyces albireticuli TaxID=1940 RepID=A0A1Z2L4D1_9ACTN|nr:MULTISPECIES: DUF4232 domain-containing protein [Streptomyces]ARZ69149.1 hypothetical protein SMD11_3516 [Streptomyces albireticuli]UQI49039.1 DUF4232 domain-containing protein [Streptomyces sp. HU2014]
MTRTRSLRLVAAAFTAAAALTLTACGGGDGSGARTSGKADTSELEETDQGGTQDGRDGADGQYGQNEAAKVGKDGKAACTSDTVKVAAKAVPSPVNHLLLVATNTSKAPCVAHGFPFLRFDADQATAGVVEESRPQSVVTLAPGKSAYAGVLAAAADGSGGNSRKARKLAVSFQGADGGGSVGGQIPVPLPGGTLAVDDSARVTYWQDASAPALKW